MFKTAFYNRLNGDATLTALIPGGVWNTLADRDADYPLVIFNRTGRGEYGTTLGNARVWRMMRYDIYGITKHVGSVTAARIDERLHELLSDHILTLTTYTHMYSRRINDIRIVEVDNGVEYEYCGGVYEFWIK